MRLPQRLANANRFITNPAMRPLARRVAPLGIVHHRGRKSGTEYSSPVLAFGIPGGYLIPLTYGPNRDWVKNVTASGRFELERRGKRVSVTNPKLKPGDAVDGLGPPWASVVRSLNLEGVLTVERAQTSR